MAVPGMRVDPCWPCVGEGLFVLQGTDRCREETGRQAGRQTDGRELAHQLRRERQLPHAKALGQDFLCLPLEQTN